MQKYLLLVLLASLCLNSFSQKFEGGFFGGFSASQIDGDKNSGYNKAGFAAGAYTNRKINTLLNWKAEIRYIQKGSYIKSPYLKTTLHYVELPVLLQHFIKRNSKIYIEGGLVPEFLFASTIKDETGVNPIDPENLFKKVGLEGTAGAGYFITDNLGGAIRITYSLFPAGGRTPGPTYIFHRGEYNNVLSFTLFYHFR